MMEANCTNKILQTLKSAGITFGFDMQFNIIYIYIEVNLIFNLYIKKWSHRALLATF